MSAAKPKNKGGRPTKYKPEYADQARRLCLLGHTDIELAEFFGVSEKTIYIWKEEFPKFLQSTIDGKEIADAKVAESLYNRANGYTCPETKAQWVGDGDGGRWEYADLQKHYPPDTQAASLWLRNRQNKRWRDKTEQDVNQKVEIDEKTQEILDKLVNKTDVLWKK